MRFDDVPSEKHGRIRKDAMERYLKALTCEIRLKILPKKRLGLHADLSSSYIKNYYSGVVYENHANLAGGKK